MLELNIEDAVKVRVSDILTQYIEDGTISTVYIVKSAMSTLQPDSVKMTYYNLDVLFGRADDKLINKIISNIIPILEDFSVFVEVFAFGKKIVFEF